MKVLIMKQVTSCSSPNHTQLPYKWPGEGTSLRGGRVKLLLHSQSFKKENNFQIGTCPRKSQTNFPRDDILRQILLLQVKNMQCTKCPWEGLCLQFGQSPFYCGATSRGRICPRKAANERPAYPASGLARPGTGWNHSQL